MFRSIIWNLRIIFWEYTFFFMSYTHKMRIMIYIATLTFASLSFQHQLLWNVVLTANTNSINQCKWKVIDTLYNIMITNMILLKEYVIFNTLLSISVECLFSLLNNMSVGWWEKQFYTMLCEHIGDWSNFQKNLDHPFFSFNFAYFWACPAVPSLEMFKLQCFQKKYTSEFWRIVFDAHALQKNQKVVLLVVLRGAFLRGNGTLVFNEFWYFLKMEVSFLLYRFFNQSKRVLFQPFFFY